MPPDVEPVVLAATQEDRVTLQKEVEQVEAPVPARRFCSRFALGASNAA